MFGLAAVCSLYWRLLRRQVLTWGATEPEASSRLPGDELLENADGVSTRAVWINAPRAAVWPWLAQNGSRATRRRLHLRLDREPAGAGHAQRRSRLARIPAAADRRHHQLGIQRDAYRARRRATRPRLALRRRELGLDLRPRRARRKNTPHQPQPVPASHADRALRDAVDGAWFARDGTQDAARNQAACRGPGVRANHLARARRGPRPLLADYCAGYRASGLRRTSSRTPTAVRPPSVGTARRAALGERTSSNKGTGSPTRA